MEPFKLPSGKTLHKISPLAGWTNRDVWGYLSRHGIEALPLYDLGYTSIGCQPCTVLRSAPTICAPAAGRARASWSAASTFRPNKLHMEIALGFIIAVFIALTGVGAGSLTTPLLILLLGLPAKECVGTALIFGTVVKVRHRAHLHGAQAGELARLRLS